MEPTTIVTDLSDLQRFVENLVGTLSTSQSSNQAVVLTLSGDLGAGKTALVQLLGKTLGVTETIVSPTFVVQKQYETTHDTFSTMIHMDAYRIESPNELQPLHFAQSLIQPSTLICIEWPERIASAITVPHHQVAITVDAADVRHIIYRYG